LLGRSSSKGIARGWLDQTDVPSWNPTYLGGVAKQGAECNGVIFPVTPAEFAGFAQREAGYKPTKIDPSQITMLGGSSTAPNGEQARKSLRAGRGLGIEDVE